MYSKWVHIKLHTLFQIWCCGGEPTCNNDSRPGHGSLDKVSGSDRFDLPLMDGLSVVCRVGSDMIMICADGSTVTLCAHTGNSTGHMNWKLRAPIIMMMTHHGPQGLACWHTYLTNMQSLSPKQTISLSAHICMFIWLFFIFSYFYYVHELSYVFLLWGTPTVLWIWPWTKTVLDLHSMSHLKIHTGGPAPYAACPQRTPSIISGHMSWSHLRKYDFVCFRWWHVQTCD